jgi:mannose-6-phosphate isomerase-like protein (cupin superfamily)
MPLQELDSYKYSGNDRRSCIALHPILLGLDMYQSTQMIDLMQRAKALSGEYENVVLGKFNDHVLRMSRMEKAYFWHFHPNSDEMFLGVEGVLILELENQRIELGPGAVFTVAQGVRHRTLPAGSYSVNLTLERLDMETVSLDADNSLST